MINNTQYIICDMINNILNVSAEVTPHPFDCSIFTNKPMSHTILEPLKKSICGFLRETEKKGGFVPGCHYHFKTSLRLSLIIVPSRENAEYLVIGPYLTEDFSDRVFSDICAAHGIPESMTAALRALYTTLPIVMGSQLERAADVAARYLSGCQEPSWETLALKLDYIVSHKSGPTEYFQLASDVLEKRYYKENQLLEAIGRGDEKAAMSMVKEWKGLDILPRPRDMVRSRKDIMLSINTLIRKKAEHCDVHPFYLDQISRKKALEIENSMTMRQLDGTIEMMVKDYCRLIRSYSLSRFSRPVQRAMNYINLNLAGDLSLNRVAAQVELSPPYLAALFKKEYKSPVTAYIHKKRIEYASLLLDRSAMPISEVASRSGFSDASYFTYLFRRSMGMTPGRYRKKRQMS